MPGTLSVPSSYLSQTGVVSCWLWQFESSQWYGSTLGLWFLAFELWLQFSAKKVSHIGQKPIELLHSHGTCERDSVWLTSRNCLPNVACPETNVLPFHRWWQLSLWMELRRQCCRQSLKCQVIHQSSPEYSWVRFSLRNETLFHHLQTEIVERLKTCFARVSYQRYRASTEEGAKHHFTWLFL